MTGHSVNGSGTGARSGAHTLLLLASPLNVLILQALEEGPKQQADLMRVTASPAQTTLRAQLKRLSTAEAIEKRHRNAFPGTVEYELTGAGRNLRFVAASVERWLAASPDGDLQLGTARAKAAIKALAEGWTSTMLRALAAGPLSLTELDRVIGSLSYPALERRLSALRRAGLAEACTEAGRSRPYAVTSWLRHGLAPLVAAARWERRHLAEPPTLRRLDTETMFLLAAPLMQLPAEHSGACRMAVEVGTQGRIGGVTIEVRVGRVVSCATDLRSDAGAWAVGSPGAWLDAIASGRPEQLEIGGDGGFAGATLAALHAALFRDAIQESQAGP